MAFLKDACQSMRSRRYFVRRGAIDWGAWDFDAHPHAVALMMDDTTFMGDFKVGTVSLEMFVRMQSSDEPTIDDSVMDELIHDAATAFEKLAVAKVPGTMDNICTLVKDSDVIIESSDAAKKVHGIIATIKVKY